MRSMNGMMMFRPGSRISWNFPRRSTTQACCCGTTRTPSTTNAMKNARSATPIENTLVPFQANAATETMSAMISLKNMLVSFGTISTEATCDRVARGCRIASTFWRTCSRVGFSPCAILNSARTSSSGPGGGCGPVAIAPRSDGLLLRDVQRAAADRPDVKDLARLAPEFAIDDRVPQRVAVLHARVAVVAVHPRVERDRLTDVE